MLWFLGAATPTPSPTPGFDANQVTPGVVGFFITLGVAVAAILLILDMVRRTRRVRYRAEIQERLAGEQLAAEAESIANREDEPPATPPRDS